MDFLLLNFDVCIEPRQFGPWQQIRVFKDLMIILDCSGVYSPIFFWKWDMVSTCSWVISTSNCCLIQNISVLRCNPCPIYVSFLDTNVLTPISILIWRNGLCGCAHVCNKIWTLQLWILCLWKVIALGNEVY